jgi:hypothetical protein
LSCFAPAIQKEESSQSGEKQQEQNTRPLPECLSVSPWLFAFLHASVVSVVGLKRVDYRSLETIAPVGNMGYDGGRLRFRHWRNENEDNGKDQQLQFEPVEVPAAVSCVPDGVGLGSGGRRIL